MLITYTIVFSNLYCTCHDYHKSQPGPEGISVADPEGTKGGANVPPFGLHLTLRSTDDKLLWNPAFWQ